MDLYKTNPIEENSRLPTELDQLQIKTARYFSRSDKELFKLGLLEKGLVGENKVIELLKDFGKEHWTVMRNVWIQLNNNQPFEYDIVVITNHGVYPLEVKNYTGTFIYENGACIENNRKMDFDIIQQARRNVLRMRRIFEQLAHPPQVKGALIFAGENNQVEIKSQVDDIEILQLTDVYAFIKRIIEDENTQYSNPLNKNLVLTTLEKLKVRHPYPPPSLSKSEVAALRQGIYCARCRNYHLKQTRAYLKCSCGYHESREEAIVRTACEYGVLTHEENFTLGEIMAFIDYQASESYVRNTLKKYFNRTLNARYTYYENKRLPYDKIHQQFDFKYPAILYTKHSKPNMIVFD